MAISSDKPKKSELFRDLFRRLLDFVFGFKNRKGEVLDSWIYPVDGFSYSPQEFYTELEQQLSARNIPSMRITKEEFSEGSLLSDNRTYLRLMRERLAIVTCAAPFGDIFFFSCRTVYVPALVRLWHILATVLFFGIMGLLLVKLLGFRFAVIALVALLFALAGVLRNASAAGFSDLDAILLRAPVIGVIYQDWFRQDTYYRQDTRNLYVNILPALIKDLAEKTCAAKGVKLEEHFRPASQAMQLNPSRIPGKES